jgi:hypothetical protein
MRDAQTFRARGRRHRRVPSPPSKGPGQRRRQREHLVAVETLGRTANTSASLITGFLLREVLVWIDASSITMFCSRAANTLDVHNAVAPSSS